MRKFCVAAVGFFLALGQVSEAKPVLSGKYGGFEHYKDADPINDEDISYIVSKDDEGDNLIFWECEYDGLNVSFRAGGQYYSDDDTHNVLYRFDKKKALELDGWTPGTNNDTLYMPIKSVKQLSRGQKSG